MQHCMHLVAAAFTLSRVGAQSNMVRYLEARQLHTGRPRGNRSTWTRGVPRQRLAAAVFRAERARRVHQATCRCPPPAHAGLQSCALAQLAQCSTKLGSKRRTPVPAKMTPRCWCSCWRRRTRGTWCHGVIQSHISHATQRKRQQCMAERSAWLSATPSRASRAGRAYRAGRAKGR